MLENIASYMLLSFILGASFAFGAWCLLMFAARCLPKPASFWHSDATSLSMLQTAQLVQLRRVELREGRVFVRLFNSTDRTYSDFLFRITARNNDGELIEDTTCVVHGFAGPQSEFDCLLKPCNRSERWHIFDPDNSLKVELVHANTA